jgi:hypothetical protein
MAKKAKKAVAKGPAKPAGKKAAAKSPKGPVDPHPCYTQYVPGSSQVLQCCWDESINDYRCRPI